MLTLATEIKEKNPGTKRRKYDASFKEEVLKMIDNGLPVTEVAQRLGIGKNLIYNWISRRTNSRQQPATVGKENSRLVISESQHVLLKRIRELETERDILKKLWVFSRQT